MSKSRWIAGIVSTSALFASLGASATTLEPIEFDNMVSSASACVMGEVVGSNVVVRDGQTFTETQFRVKETAFGSTGQLIVVETPGGERKMGRLNGAEVVAGSPRFFDQEESVLFIQPIANSSSYAPVGFNQGVLNVVNGVVSLPADFGGSMNASEAMDVIGDVRVNPESDAAIE